MIRIRTVIIGKSFRINSDDFQTDIVCFFSDIIGCSIRRGTDKYLFEKYKYF